MNQICSHCKDMGFITYNINGKCDVCSCTSWQDLNDWPEPERRSVVYIRDNYYYPMTKGMAPVKREMVDKYND
jgi:hypothetical protein